MVNRRKKVKGNEETRWGNLPQDILGIILAKLPDLNSVDVIRFRAVCKNWQIEVPEAMKIKYNDDQNLPWLCNLSWSADRFECEIYDPYSRQIFKTWKHCESRRYTRSYSRKVECFGSKQGWLIAGYHNHFIKWEVFMYNPYSTEFISLPFILKEKHHPCFATFSGNPTTQDCRVFVFLSYEGFPRDSIDNYIAIYGLNGEKEWEVKCIGETREYCCGMQYMNEQLFCLFRDGVMLRYSLEDGLCTQIVVGEGSRRLSGHNLRLMLVKRGEEDLLVAFQPVAGFSGTQCSTFYFDWSDMSWIVSDLQKSSAIFISGKLTVFVRPFKDYGNQENMVSCEVYLFDDKGEGKRHPSYYTFTEMRKQQLYYIYPSTVFIEPPPRIN